MTKKICALLREISPAISAGILSADWMALESEIRILKQGGVHVLHFDVMDGCFVPALTFGAPLVKAVRTSLLKDVHLMINDPLAKIPEFVAAGADMITIHPESSIHAHRALQRIGESVNANDPNRGIARGVALNPGTPLSASEPLLDVTDVVFLLAVNPGFSGQTFIEGTRDRFARLRSMVRETRLGRDILLGIDGGITRKNIAEIAAMGPDIIISGSAIFDGKAARENTGFMQDAIKAKDTARA